MVKYDRVATTNLSSDDVMDGDDQENGDTSISVVPLDASPDNRNKPSLIRRANSQKSLGSHHSRGAFGEEGTSLDHEEESGIHARTTATHSGAMSPTSPGSLSSQPMYPTLGTMFNGPSFDLDDDDDEDDVDLSRYHLDFKSNDRGHALSNGSLQGTPRYGRRFSFCQWLWHKFQSARQKARERRAQLLLQQTDPNWQQSTWIFIMTLCDATDRGIFLVASLMVAWIIAIVLNKHNPIVRRNIIIIGSALLMVRLGTRPLFEYCIRQRLKRRQSSMQPTQQHSQSFRDSRTVRASSDISSPYLDQEMKENNGSNSMSDLELTLMRRNSAKDDLTPDLQITDSNESDPMIAAI
jgi:hypothetical protein